MAFNLRKIDLNLLVIFEALYATGSTGRAAERLGMSQPAVSNALGRLRDLIGDQLFVRDTRGLKPTSKSNEIIRPVREALGVIGSQLITSDSIDLSTYQRQFRVIIADPFEPILMPPIVRAITTERRVSRSNACRPPRDLPRISATAGSILPALLFRSTARTSSRRCYVRSSSSS